MSGGRGGWIKKNSISTTHQRHEEQQQLDRRQHQPRPPEEERVRVQVVRLRGASGVPVGGHPGAGGEPHDRAELDSQREQHGPRRDEEDPDAPADPVREEQEEDEEDPHGDALGWKEKVFF